MLLDVKWRWLVCCRSQIRFMTTRGRHHANKKWPRFLYLQTSCDVPRKLYLLVSSTLMLCARLSQGLLCTACTFGSCPLADGFPILYLISVGSLGNDLAAWGWGVGAQIYAEQRWRQSTTGAHAALGVTGALGPRLSPRLVFCRPMEVCNLVVRR